MKIFSILLLTALVAIGIENSMAKYLLIDVDDTEGVGNANHFNRSTNLLKLQTPEISSREYPQPCDMKKYGDEALRNFDNKHVVYEKRDGKIDKTKAARKSCERNLMVFNNQDKFTLDNHQQVMRNTVVYKTIDEIDFRSYKSTALNYCAATFPEVYVCVDVPVFLANPSLDHCVQVVRCRSCKDVDYGPEIQGTVKAFIMQVGQLEGHLDYGKAEVIGESGTKTMVNLREKCDPNKL